MNDFYLLITSKLNTMKKSNSIAVTLTAALFITIIGAAQAQDTTSRQDTAQVKSDATQSAGDLLGVIASSPDYSTLAKVITAANIEAQLKATGPFTIFAPINQGFVTLTQAKLDSLVKDGNGLKSALQYHIVQGRYSKAELIKALSAGNRTATLPTVGGDTLSLAINAESNLEITDGKGNKALVTSFDQTATNGVIHGINNVLLPK